MIFECFYQINSTHWFISYPTIYFFYGSQRQKYSYTEESGRSAETILKKLEEFYHEEKNYKNYVVGYCLIITAFFSFLIYVARRATIRYEKDIENEISMKIYLKSCTIKDTFEKYFFVLNALNEFKRWFFC